MVQKIMEEFDELKNIDKKHCCSNYYDVTIKI